MQLSAKFGLTKSLTVLISRSTEPVAVCIYGAPCINFMFRSLHIVPNSFQVNAVPVSTLIVWGIPFNRTYCFGNVVAVFLVRASRLRATGHLLERSIEISLKNRHCLNPIGPMKSNWISWFGFSADGVFF